MRWDGSSDEADAVVVDGEVVAADYKMAVGDVKVVQAGKKKIARVNMMK